MTRITSMSLVEGNEWDAWKSQRKNVRDFNFRFFYALTLILYNLKFFNLPGLSVQWWCLIFVYSETDFMCLANDVKCFAFKQILTLKLLSGCIILGVSLRVTLHGTRTLSFMHISVFSTLFYGFFVSSLEWS